MTTDLSSHAMLYAPVMCYLMLVLGQLAVFHRVPVWFHGVALVLGVTALTFQTAALELAATLGLAAAAFFLLVLLAGQTVSGVTLLSTVVTFALTPLDGWLWVFSGMLVAALVAGVRTWRAMGKERVAWLAMDTLGGVGISTMGRLQKPEFEHIPRRDVLTDVHDGSEMAKKVTMYLPPYLFLGVVLAAVITYWT